MISRMSRGAVTAMLALLALFIMACAGIGNIGLSRSVSEGMPQAQPGQVIVQPPAPTLQPELVATREVAQPPITDIITPTASPINPPPLTGNEGTDITGIEPQPVNPGDAGSDQSNNQAQSNDNLPPASGIDESVQPFPAGSRPTGASSSAGSSNVITGSAGYACGRRIVHVVQPGQNIFRIALRYDTTINAIVWRNGIDDVRTVRPGTRLVVVTCEQR